MFYGVSKAISALMRKKRTSSSDKDIYKKRNNIIHAVNDLITIETKKSKELAEWMKNNKDVFVTIDGFELPVNSLFAKYMDPMQKVR